MMSEISDDLTQKLKEKSVVTDIESEMFAFAVERMLYLFRISQKYYYYCINGTKVLKVQCTKLLSRKYGYLKLP